MTRWMTLSMCGLLWMAAPVAAGPYAVESGQVTFRSEAPMESFEGTTEAITGRLFFDPNDLSAGLRCGFSVDLTTLDTGIDMRNSHMRDNHLQTDQYPTATFRGGTATGTLSESGGRVMISGTFHIHGVGREIEVPVEVTPGADGSLAVVAKFGVKLSDHNIPRPKFLFVKLADEQAVTVSFVARPVAD